MNQRTRQKRDHGQANDSPARRQMGTSNQMAARPPARTACLSPRRHPLMPSAGEPCAYAFSTIGRFGLVRGDRVYDATAAFGATCRHPAIPIPGMTCSSRGSRSCAERSRQPPSVRASPAGSVEVPQSCRQPGQDLRRAGELPKAPPGGDRRTGDFLPRPRPQDPGDRIVPQGDQFDRRPVQSRADPPCRTGARTMRLNWRSSSASGVLP